MRKRMVDLALSLDWYIAAEGDDSFGLGFGVGSEPWHARLTNGNLKPEPFRLEHGVNADIFGEIRRDRGSGRR